MSDSPIFDQLIVEFAQERDIHFPRLIGANKILTKKFIELPTADPEETQLMDPIELDHEDETPTAILKTDEVLSQSAALAIKEDIEKGQFLVKKDSPLYDASRLKLIKPAIPEFDATSAMQRLREADEELGLNEFDEAFKIAAKDLEPRVQVKKGDITYTGPDAAEGVKAIAAIESASHVKPVTKGGVRPVRRETILPRRKNKRGSGVKGATADQTQQFNFFETSASSSPGSTA